MTEDFKIYAKDYIAKSVQSGSQGDYELFYGDYGGWATIYDDYDTNAVIKCVKQVVSPKNVGVMWTIVVLWSNTLLKGRFAVLDENGNIVSIIDKYDNDNNIGCYYCLETDNKGRLYGIEWFNQDKVRYVMLNNISVSRYDEYYALVRKTYNVPELNGHQPPQDATTVGYILKNDNKHGIVLSIPYGNIEIYTFEIDVENGNTWKEALTSNVLWETMKPLITYNTSNNFTFKIIGNQQMVDPSLKVDTIVENDSGLTATQNVIISNSNGLETLSNSDIWFIDNTNILVPFKDSNKFYLQTLDLTGDTFVKVYEEEYSTDHITAKFAKSNNYCFMYVFGYNESPNVDSYKESIYHIFKPDFSSTTTYNIFEKIINDEIGEPPFDNVDFYIVNNQYNLYNHIVGRYAYDPMEVDEHGLSTDVYQEIYNENNYNGNPYISSLTSSIIPQQFVLKTNNRVLFARNIYNKMANGNIVDINLQIPNTLINNTEIKNEILWSSTKLTMNDEHTSIIKNKYEELIFNIRNVLNIIDDNDENYELLSDVSAFIHQGLAGIEYRPYLMYRLYYAKINYHDNTTENIALSVNNRTDEKTTLEFEVNVSKQIDSIELTSQTGFSYITITPTLEVGKTYNIKQDVRIGD